MHYCSRTLFPSLIGLFFVFQWKKGFKKMCWFDVDFQNNSKVTEVLGPRPLTYMCPTPPKRCQIFFLWTAEHLHLYTQNKACRPFPPHHTEASPISHDMDHQTLLQVTYSHVQWITLSYKDVNLSNSAIRQIRVLSIHNYV